MASFAAFVKEINERESYLKSWTWPRINGEPRLWNDPVITLIPRDINPTRIEREWTEPSPIGRYFNIVEDTPGSPDYGEIVLQGKVYGEPTFGEFNVAFVDTNTEEEFDGLVKTSGMEKWLWYETADDMRESYYTFFPSPIPAQVAGVPASPVQSVKVPKSTPAPMGRAAFHGIVGDFVKIVEPSTEGDINALVIAFLTAFGCLFGRQPYHYVEDTRHGTNLFSVIVGESSKARKGTITGRVMNLLKMSSKEFYEKRLHKGLSSGEGLVYSIRDAREDPQAVPTPGDPEPLPSRGKPNAGDVGVADKRLLVVESEFGSVLQQGKRDGNILSEVMRNGWDGSALGSMAKTNQDRCLHPHVSLIGNITVDELQRCLSEKDRSNGFGNRILWAYAKRSKILSRPDRVPDRDLQIIADRIIGLTMFRMPGELKWSKSAWPLWDAEYARLSAEGTGDGLVDALTARAEAQVLRIAMIYAVLDSSDFIERVHLEAALEVWRYCEDSAKFIFGGSTGNKLAEEILGLLLAKPEGMSQTELSAAFGRNKPVEQLKGAIEVLIKMGRVRTEERKQATGRAATVWAAVVI